ncbi:spore germination protein KB [Paenibacillus sp. 1_12]|uniref:GerAB/ArcD/ProY family transporter n=1 Tax=Paenibacillus sp. 1_12 TaxID=1566278 RepID=UPI0008E8EE93|nr:endospore germination permease [Paenibacillus sp. 1_12]SFL53611.1 spore germination protein KB [Paenibacillus sp. 1_12]
MIENGKISPSQFGITVFMYTLGSAVLLMPSVLATIAKQDAWITVLMMIPAVLLLIQIWTQLARMFPHESIIQYSERILGKWLGKIVALLYLSYFIFLTALVLRNVGGFITTHVLVETPMQFVHIIFMVAVVYGAYLGLEVLARTSEIFFPWVLGIYFLTSILLIHNIDLSKLLPILPDGWMPPIKAIYPLLGFPLSELVVFLIILPFVNNQNKSRKYFNLFMVMNVIFGTIIVVITISVLGVDLTARSTFAVFDVAKEIAIGKFFSRVEILVGGIWIMTIFVKLSFCFYVTNIAFAQFFKMKSFRITILPFGLIVIPLSMIVYKNTGEFSTFSTMVYPIYSLFHGLVIPLILLCVAKIRKLKGKVAAESSVK